MHVLLADDERAIAITLADDLKRIGHDVQVAADGAEARELFAAGEFDVVVTDINMPGATGMELLEEIKASGADTQVILITGYGTIENAVAAMRKGAFDYVLKPFGNDEILEKLRKIHEFRRLRHENRALRAELGREKGLANIVGTSDAMQRVLDRIRTVASREARVLITGESGTGKERVARAIHDISGRADQPFIPLACAAIPSQLLEDEIFGHEQGAFTDAKETKIGRFEMADGGTLFLDDIDDMPMETQVKLLRVLQESIVERLGGREPIKVDVRVIAATKVDLLHAVEDGEFREDLYYRLNVVPIDLPPLRDRDGDVPLLVEHFMGRFGGDETFEIPPEVMAELSTYRWPGNVRELENAVERAVALAGPDHMLTRELLLEGALRRRRKGMAEPEGETALVTLKEVVREAEAKAIRRTLAATGGHRANAAKVLGISRKNLWEKMKDYTIE